MEISRKPGKTLSVFSLIMINVIAIDSIRNLPISAAMGYACVMYYILGSLLFFIPGILVSAELATHYPKTGGSYVWAREAFGPRVGFTAIWLLWIYNVVWFPTILSFIAATGVYWLAPTLANSKLFMVPTVVGVFVLASLANSFGMKVSSWVSTLGAIFGTIIPMILIIALGALWIIQGHPLTIQPTWHTLLPSLDSTNNLAFVVVVLFSLMGIEMSAVHAGEVKNPQRDYPRALLISAIIIVTSIILSSLALAMVIPPDTLNILSGIGQAFSILLAPYGIAWLLPFITLMILIGAFAGMSAWVLGPAKGFMVATQDSTLPKWMRHQTKTGTPTGMLLAQALVVCVISLLFLCFSSINTAYWILTDLTAQLALLYYIILFATAIRLRYKALPQANAYRIPGTNIGIWVVGLIGIGTCITAIGLSFLPPSVVPPEQVFHYELTLIGGILVLLGLPSLLYRAKKANY